MLSRIERKMALIQRWVDSVESIADWPAAIALAMFRTRPTRGSSVAARWSRRLFPHIWIRPARLGGLAVRITPSELSQFVIFEEAFVEGSYPLDQVPFTPDAIIDCGAFEGYFSLLATRRFPGVPITAFEPNERNMDGLKANVQRNRLNIDLRPAAVSTTDGTASFSGSGCGGHLGSPTTESVVVPVIDLRRLIAELGAERLLLKLDIEGEEATLLPALLPILPKRCALFFEWHQGVDEYQRIVARLNTDGFATALLRENQDDDGKVYIDAFAERH